jgi:hypothetical protein
MVEGGNEMVAGGKKMPARERGVNAPTKMRIAPPKRDATEKNDLSTNEGVQ